MTESELKELTALINEPTPIELIKRRTKATAVFIAFIPLVILTAVVGIMLSVIVALAFLAIIVKELVLAFARAIGLTKPFSPPPSNP